MYIVTIKARPNPKKRPGKLSRDAGGAFVNCWINYQDNDGACLLSHYYVEREGWIVEKIVEVKAIVLRQQKKKTDKQYAAEAVKYGYSLVFHVWPKGTGCG